jgi:hypothetical protein
VSAARTRGVFPTDKSATAIWDFSLNRFSRSGYVLACLQVIRVSSTAIVAMTFVFALKPARSDAL